MAPVVCMTDFPMPRTDAAYPYTRRRQRNRLAVGIVEKYRTLEMRQMSVARARVGSPRGPTSSSSLISLSATSSEANCRDNHLESSLFPTRFPIERDEQWIILKRRAGLLNIVARTIDLVRRNHILEKKVEALRLETRSFVNSVLNNPENGTSVNERRGDFSLCRDAEIKKKRDSISSTTEEKSSWSTSIVTEGVEHESRRQISKDRESFAKSERETRSSNTMVY